MIEVSRDANHIGRPSNGSIHAAVSRLYAHSKNYDMDLTLDYNVELYPLQKDQSIALALAACGADGPPERPAAQGAPRTGVTFGGEASFGVNL